MTLLPGQPVMIIQPLRQLLEFLFKACHPATGLATGTLYCGFKTAMDKLDKWQVVMIITFQCMENMEIEYERHSSNQHSSYNKHRFSTDQSAKSTSTPPFKGTKFTFRFRGAGSLKSSRWEIIALNHWELQLWPWLPVITGYFYGIIHSINGVISTYNW